MHLGRSEAYPHIPSLQLYFLLGRGLAKKKKKSHTWNFPCWGLLFFMVSKCWSASRLSLQTSLPFMQKLIILHMLLVFLISWFCPNFSFCLKCHATLHSMFSAFLNSAYFSWIFLDVCHFSLKMIILLLKVLVPLYFLYYIICNIFMLGIALEFCLQRHLFLFWNIKKAR